MKDSRNVRTVNRALRGLAALLFIAAWGARARADIIYDTTPYWDGSTAIAPWGSVQSGWTPTYGQTFYAPTVASSLLSFTFYLTDFTPGDVLTYQAAVYAWSGSLQGGNGPQGAVGPALYTSDQVFVDNGSFQAVTINTGGVSLAPGGAYVVLLTTSDPESIAQNSSSQSLFEFGLTGYGVHQPNDGGGGFNFDNNLNSSTLNTSPWDDYGPDLGDLAWTGVFQPQSVPEPGSLTLLGIGVVGIIVSQWRRRTTSQ